MNPRLPTPKYTYEPEFRWPWNKFSLHPEALFTSLHERFNTRSSAIQEPYAFHRDVIECANDSATVEEFYVKLAERKNERINELDAAWTDIAHILVRKPALFSCSSCRGTGKEDETEDDLEGARWEAFVRLCRAMSSDRLVLFLDEFVKFERERRKKERAERRRLLDKLFPRKTDAAKNETGITMPGGSADNAGANPDSSSLSNATEPRPTTLEPSTTQFLKPDDEQICFPSSESASSGLLDTSEQGGASTSVDEETQSVGQRVTSASDLLGTSMSNPSFARSTDSSRQAKQVGQKLDRRTCLGEQSVDTGGAGKGELPRDGIMACSPLSPEPRFSKAASTEGTVTVDQSADTNPRQTPSRASSSLPDTEPVPSLGSTPASTPASPSTAPRDSSVNFPHDALIPMYSCSAKRKNRSRSESGTEDESSLHEAKRQRLFTSHAEFCDDLGRAGSIHDGEGT